MSKQMLDVPIESKLVLS